MSDEKTEPKISIKTRTRAYAFIKSLMADGYDGAKVHNLIDGIREHVSEEAAGRILMDLLKTPKDVEGDVKRHYHWFGPVKFNYFAAITSNWRKFLNDHEIRGCMYFGGVKAWEDWCKLDGDKMSKTDLEKRAARADYQIVCFEWWSDDAVAKKARAEINRTYQWIVREED